METIVQFIAPGHAFMARGQRHIVRHVFRQPPNVLVIGEREDGSYFDAEFPWGETVDIIDSMPERVSGRDPGAPGAAKLSGDVGKSTGEHDGAVPTDTAAIEARGTRA